MKSRELQPGKSPSGAGANRLPVARDYVDDVQHRVAKLTEDAESTDKTDHADDIARRQQEAFQRHMAQLRSETVQARRLAEHILNLSREGTIQPRESVMNDASIVDPVRPGSASGKSRASGNQSNFNPLHPSMELPPEQLIRLLGLAGKPTRRQRAPGPRKIVVAPDKLADPDGASEASPGTRSRAEVGSAATRQRTAETGTIAGQDKTNRTALLWPAVIVSALGGVAASLYVLWSAPSPEQIPATQSSVTVEPSGTGTAILPREIVAPAASLATPITRAPTRSNPLPAADDTKWRAAVEAQQQQLRNAADARFRETLQSVGSSVGEHHSLPSRPSEATTSSVVPAAPSAEAYRPISNKETTPTDFAADATYVETEPLASSPAPASSTPPPALTRPSAIAPDDKLPAPLDTPASIDSGTSL